MQPSAACEVCCVGCARRAVLRVHALRCAAPRPLGPHLQLGQQVGQQAGPGPGEVKARHLGEHHGDLLGDRGESTSRGVRQGPTAIERACAAAARLASVLLTSAHGGSAAHRTQRTHLPAPQSAGPAAPPGPADAPAGAPSPPPRETCRGRARGVEAGQRRQDGGQEGFRATCIVRQKLGARCLSGSLPVVNARICSPCGPACSRLLHGLPAPHPGSRDRQYLLQLFLKCTAASQRAEWSASLLARISCRTRRPDGPSVGGNSRGGMPGCNGMQQLLAAWEHNLLQPPVPRDC